jgi:hypothetical protein
VGVALLCGMGFDSHWCKLRQRDHITIDNGNFAAMAGYTIKIENNAGQQVFQSAINQQQFYVDLSTWTGNGLYFVHLIDPQNNTVTVRKIVLQ